MGFNVWTSALQPVGLTQSMVRIGPKYVAMGLAQWLGDAVQMESTTKRIYEQSTFMRNRARTMQREINEIQNRVAKNGRFSIPTGAYFLFIQKMQLVADIPTWLGEFNKAKANGHDDSTAVAMADQAVLDSQSGGQIKDLAQIQRGHPLLKLFTQFYSYFNMTWNLNAESFNKHVKGAKGPMDIAKYAVDFLLLYSLPATITALMYEALRGGECDDLECLGEKVARENVSYLLGSLVLFRELSGAVSGYGYSGPSGTRFFSEFSRAYKQWEQGDVDAAAVRATGQTLGILFHVPAAQMQRTIEGIIAIIEGDVEGVDAVKAPLFGPPR